jgi:hypothetical protein
MYKGYNVFAKSRVPNLVSEVLMVETLPSRRGVERGHE